MDKTIEDFIAWFKQCVPNIEDIEFTVHILDNKEELLKRRIEMTPDGIFKDLIKSESKAYLAAKGCFIIPPVCEKSFDILLCGENIEFLLWHEMVHIFNLIRARGQCEMDYIGIYSNIDFCNIDEFLARAISNIIFVKYHTQGVSITIEQNIFDEMLNSLFANIQESELQSGMVKRYNLMQYLGTVASGKILCGKKFVTPEFVENNQVVKEVFEWAMNFL